MDIVSASPSVTLMLRHNEISTPVRAEPVEAPRPSTSAGRTGFKQDQVASIVSHGHTVEGIARVVSIDGARIWLEPEQTSSCGSCASAAHCSSPGAPGIGTVANRIHARRFPLDNTAGLRVGERVVIGVDYRALVRGSLVAYGLPLLTTLLAGAVAQGAWQSDGMTIVTMVAGMGAGFACARIAARRLAARGELEPRFLRRATANEICDTPQASMS